MKKKIFLIFIISLFFPLSALNAGLFPNNSKSVVIDAHTGTSGILLNNVNYERTIIYASVQCNSTGDYHITIGNILTQPNNNNVINTEQIAGLQTFVKVNIPINTDVYWQKPASADKCFYRLIYTDYDLNLLSDFQQTTPTATSTLMTLSNNIENIGYISTSSIDNLGRTITQGTYFIPYILFQFILAIFAMTIFTIILLLFFKRKKHDA